MKPHAAVTFAFAALALSACVVPRGDRPTYAACANAIPEGRWFYTDDPGNSDYKRVISHTPDNEYWNPRIATPASQGMNAQLLDDGAAAFSASAKNAASFLVLRHGRLVKESYYLGHDAGTSKNVHSSSKSILSGAIGIAIEHGWIRSRDPAHLNALDEKVSWYLPQYAVPEENQQLTLRHLLTMTAGLEWREDKSEDDIVQGGGDWIDHILNLARTESAGKTFHYSTANTHLLSAILTHELNRHGAPELDTCSFVHRYLFSPLGISAEFWGRDPQGIFSGGYDVYLTPRELAKIGLLYLHGGRWDGEQIISRDWVRDSTARHVKHDETSDLYYGYNWFVRRLAGHEAFYSWGYGGQHVFVVPDLDLVAVLTTDTHDTTLPEYEDAYRVVQSYVIPAVSGRPR
jgi:CubicO group peptidase (beta-lactamase class C family)